MAGALALAVAALTAGCGSSSTAPGREPGSSDGAGPQAARRYKEAEAAGAITDGSARARARAPYKGTDDDERNETGAKPVQPCALVTRSEARSILGGPVATPESAPQGPTCIYRAKNAKSLVTVSVAPTRTSILGRRRRSSIRLKLGGRRAYCIKYGALSLLVPLSGGQVLDVTAPCPIAARFAAKALPRLIG